MTLTRLMFSSLEWSLPNNWINMNMPDVWKPFNGSVSFVLLRHQTRWGLKYSTLVMGSSTLMVLTKRSGCVAINAKRLSICAVLLKRKKKISNSHSCAGSMSVGSRRNVKWVIKLVIFSFLVARQKTTQKKVRRGKDGRIIAPRKPASAGYKVKEQRKRRKKEPEPQQSSSRCTYTWKNPNGKNPLISPVPLVIAPTTEGLYQLPAWVTRLTSVRLYRLVIVYFCF